MCRAGTAGVGRIERACLLRVLQRDDELLLVKCKNFMILHRGYLVLRSGAATTCFVENGLCRCWLEQYYHFIIKLQFDEVINNS